MLLDVQSQYKKVDITKSNIKIHHDFNQNTKNILHSTGEKNTKIYQETQQAMNIKTILKNKNLAGGYKPRCNDVL